MKKILSITLTLIILMGAFCFPAHAVQTLVLGDVSGNGIVSTADVQRVLLNVESGKALPEETAILADYDYNGTVNKTDAYSILRCAAGIAQEQTLEFTDWQVTTQPTCSSKGSAQSVCEAKGLTRTKSLAKLDHNFVDGVCSACGVTEGTDGVIYVQSKSIRFGDSISALTSKFGTPTEILNDTISGKAVKYYVYANNYNKLVIFTCTNADGIIGVYTNDSTSSISDGNRVAFADVANSWQAVNDVYMYGFLDKIGTNQNHAVYASTDASSYSSFSASTNFTTQEKLVFYCVNGTRAQNGKTTLIYDDEIAKMALYHSKDMADNDYFSHTAPSGETFSDRIKAFDIYHMGAGENIAAGYMSAYSLNNGWYNSEGHRNNMLNDYTHLGVGIAYGANSSYRFYATQNFRALS